MAACILNDVLQFLSWSDVINLSYVCRWQFNIISSCPIPARVGLEFRRQGCRDIPSKWIQFGAFLKRIMPKLEVRLRSEVHAVWDKPALGRASKTYTRKFKGVDFEVSLTAKYACVPDPDGYKFYKFCMVQFKILPEETLIGIANTKRSGSTRHKLKIEDYHYSDEELTLPENKKIAALYWINLALIASNDPGLYC